MKYTIIALKPAQVSAAGYIGPRGGYPKGTHYCLYETGKGFCSLDKGKTTYMLAGREGLKAMERIIETGGFIGEIAYRQVL